MRTLLWQRLVLRELGSWLLSTCWTLRNNHQVFWSPELRSPEQYYSHSQWQCCWLSWSPRWYPSQPHILSLSWSLEALGPPEYWRVWTPWVLASIAQKDKREWLIFSRPPNPDHLWSWKQFLKICKYRNLYFVDFLFSSRKVMNAHLCRNKSEKFTFDQLYYLFYKFYPIAFWLRGVSIFYNELLSSSDF